MSQHREYFFFLQCLPKFFKICCQNIDLLSLFSEPEVVNLTKYLVVLHQKTSYYLYWNYERRKSWFPEYFFLKIMESVKKMSKLIYQDKFWTENGFFPTFISLYCMGQDKWSNYIFLRKQFAKRPNICKRYVVKIIIFLW